MHRLNCISSCPLGGLLMDGRSRDIVARGKLCNHCLLLESSDSLTLVDTEFGLRDVSDPRSRLSGFFLHLMSPELREEMTAARQVERLSLYQTMMEKSRRDRLGNQARLRALKREHGSTVDIFSAHDTAEFERLAGRPVRMPPLPRSGPRGTPG